MADLRGLYDPGDKPDEGYELLPAGAYTVKITGSEMKDAKTGNGKYLNVEMTVVEGQYDGKKIFARLNLINANKEAVRIAKGQFAALREAVGVLEPKDSSELENIRFQVELKCVKRKDNDQMSNEIAKYIKKGQSATTPQQNNGNAPWAKNAPKPGEEPPAVADADVPF